MATIKQMTPYDIASFTAREQSIGVVRGLERLKALLDQRLIDLREQVKEKQ